MSYILSLGIFFGSLATSTSMLVQLAVVDPTVLHSWQDLVYVRYIQTRSFEFHSLAWAVMMENIYFCSNKHMCYLHP